MTTPKDFPLLNECVAQGDVIACFPLMKNWDRQKLNALMDEIERADEGVADEWGKIAVKAENFLSKSRSQALDKEKLEAFCMLFEISSVALYYIGRYEEREKSAAIEKEAQRG